jgi:hypothetical protein
MGPGDCWAFSPIISSPRRWGKADQLLIRTCHLPFSKT